MEENSDLTEPLAIGRSSESELLVKGEKDLLFNLVPADWIFLPPEGSDVTVANDSTATLYLLLNSMIGIGILFQAYVFKRTGVILATIEYILVAVMNTWGIEMLVNCAEHKQIFDYSGVATAILGPYGGLGVDASIALANAGAILTDILVIGTLISDSEGHCHQWYCDISVLTVAPVLAVSMPFCLIRRFGHLAAAAYLSMLAIVSIVLLVIIGGPIESSKSGREKEVHLASAVGAIETIGTIVFSLGYITSVFHAYRGMEDKSVPKFRVTANTAIAVGVGACFIVGLGGYLSFTSDTDTNILENFRGSLGGVFKVLFAIHILLFIPGEYVIFRASWLKLYNTEVTSMSDTNFLFFTISSFLVFCFVGALMQETLRHGGGQLPVMSITGGIAGSFLYFIFPGLCGVYTFTKDSPDYNYYRSYALVIFGSCISILVIVGVALSY